MRNMKRILLIVVLQTVVLTSTITEALQRYTHRRVDDPHRVWNYDRGQLQQAQPSAVPGRTVAVADRSPDFRKYHHRSQPPSTVDNPFQPRPSASTFSAAEWTPVVPLPKGLFSDLEQRDRAPQWSWVRGPSSAVSFEAPPMTADDKGRRDRNHHYDLDVSFNDSKGDSYRNHQPPPRANASVPVEQQRQHYDSDPTAYYYRPHDGYQNVKTRAEELLRQTKGRPQADANTNGEITTLNFGGVTNSRPQNVNAVIEIENERPRVYYDKTVNIIPSFDDDSRHKHQNYVHAPGGKKNDYYSHFANTNLNEKNVEENQRLNVEKTAENQVVSSYNHDVNANGSDEGFEFQNTNVNNGTSDHRRQHSYFDFHAESADTKGTRQIGYSGAAAKTNSWLYPTQTHHANSIDQKVENNHHRSNNYYHQHGSVDDAETTDRENDRDRGAIGADSNGKFHNYEDSVNSIGKLNNYEVSETSNGGDEDDSTTTGKIHRRIVSTRTGQEDGKDRQAALQDTERRRRRRPLTVAAASNSTDVPKLSDEAAASRQRRRRVQTSTRRPPVAVEENTAGDSQHGYGERLDSRGHNKDYRRFTTPSGKLVSNVEQKPSVNGHDMVEGVQQRGYGFGYTVLDEYAGTNFGQWERREPGRPDTVSGEYRVLLPDGRTQTVAYSSDPVTGYKASVTYESDPRYPMRPSPAVTQNDSTDSETSSN